MTRVLLEATFTATAEVTPAPSTTENAACGDETKE